MKTTISIISMEWIEHKNWVCFSRRMFICWPELKRTIRQCDQKWPHKQSINTTNWIAAMNRRKTQTNEFSGIFCCCWIRLSMFACCISAYEFQRTPVYSLWIAPTHYRTDIDQKTYRHNIFISMLKSIKYDINNSSKWIEMIKRWQNAI